MYKLLRVAVVIPAYNEERALPATLRSVPGFVDHVVVVDDASQDATYRVALRSRRRHVEVVRHEVNRGVGAAIVTGYRRALSRGADVAAVMAGDGQMDPADLPGLLDPIARGAADYVKGNRFTRLGETWRAMPRTRFFGNVLLSLATRVTSGYWHLFDSQCGYTAATRRALEAIELDRMFPRYGYPNDLLARLHAAGMRVSDVPVRPVYGPAWRSGISWTTVIYPVSFVLLRSWLERWAAEFGQWLRAPQAGTDPASAPAPAPLLRSLAASEEGLNRLAAVPSMEVSGEAPGFAARPPLAPTSDEV